MHFQSGKALGHALKFCSGADASSTDIYDES